MMRLLSVADLRDKVLSELQSTGFHTTIERLRRSLGQATPTYVVGGFVRDCARALFDDRRVDAKDVDVVVETSRLEEALAALPGEREVTPLGGCRLWPSATSGWIDVWQLADTAWIARLGLAPTIDNFLAGVHLNVDRVALGLHDHSVRDRGFLTAIAARRIDLDADVALDELFPAELRRAVIAHFKTGYALSERVAQRLSACGDEILSPSVLERLRRDGHGDEMMEGLTRFLRAGRRGDAPKGRGGNSHHGTG